MKNSSEWNVHFKVPQKGFELFNSMICNMFDIPTAISQLRVSRQFKSLTDQATEIIEILNNNDFPLIVGNCDVTLCSLYDYGFVSVNSSLLSESKIVMKVVQTLYSLQLIGPTSNIKLCIGSSSHILKKLLIPYCHGEYHQISEVQNLPQSEIFEFILAGHWLNMDQLLEISCKTVAEMIKGKTPEQIRQTFNIVNDYTPEEEEQIRKENEWCEEI